MSATVQVNYVTDNRSKGETPELTSETLVVSSNVTTLATTEPLGGSTPKPWPLRPGMAHVTAIDDDVFIAKGTTPDATVTPRWLLPKGECIPIYLGADEKVGVTLVHSHTFTSAASFNVDEDEADTTPLYTAAATPYPAGTTLTYSLVDDAGGLFEIVAGTGVVSLATGATLDYETATSHTLIIQVSGDGRSSELTVTANVVDVNDTAPVFTSAAAADVPEDAVPGDTLYTATVTDADTTGESITYSLTVDDTGRFEIGASTGIVTLAAAQSMDYETATSHNITVRASDGVNHTDLPVTLNVLDVNDNAPVFTSSNSATVAEDIDDVTVIYTATVTDADTVGTIAFSITVDADDLFEIDGVSGEVTLQTGKVLDYATATSHSITVRADDGVNHTDLGVTINVTEVV